MVCVVPHAVDNLAERVLVADGGLEDDILALLRFKFERSTAKRENVDTCVAFPAFTLGTHRTVETGEYDLVFPPDDAAEDDSDAFKTAATSSNVLDFRIEGEIALGKFVNLLQELLVVGIVGLSEEFERLLLEFLLFFGKLFHDLPVALYCKFLHYYDSRRTVVLDFPFDESLGFISCPETVFERAGSVIVVEVVPEEPSLLLRVEKDLGRPVVLFNRFLDNSESHNQSFGASGNGIQWVTLSVWIRFSLWNIHP